MRPDGSHGRELHYGVMGAGSIGCYLGGKLMETGAEVTLVGRGRLRDELAGHGLTTTGLDEPRRHHDASDVRYTDDPEALAAADVVLCCVKSAQTAEVGETLARVLTKGQAVVSVQNGVRNAEILRAALGERPVVPAICGFNVVGRGAGVFHRGTDGQVMLEKGTDAAHTVYEALRHAGVPAVLEGDIAPHQWTKLLINLNNAVSALSGAPTQALLTTSVYRRVMAALIEEGAAVLRSAGIRTARLRGLPVRVMPTILRLPDGLVRLILAQQMKTDPEARSSMWEDLERRRRTEVDYLNGEIVRLAEAHGRDAPLNRRIVTLVRQAEERGGGSPGLSPEALRVVLEDA